MPLPTPILDDRSYQQLRDELVRRIPVYAPEWTDFNASDPGITLIELLAFHGENLLYRFNQFPEATRLGFLRLLQVPLQPAVAAVAIVTLTTQQPAGSPVPLGTELRAGSLSFQTQTDVVAWPVSVLAVARVQTAAPVQATEPDVYDFAVRTLDALGPLPPGQTPAYYQNQTVSPDGSGLPVDFSSAVDGMLWVAVLDGGGADVTQMGAGLLNLGFVPDPVVPTMDQVAGCPGNITQPASEPVEWQVSSGSYDAANNPVYTMLTVVGDTTRGLTQEGIVRLQMPAKGSPVGTFAVSDPDLAGTGDLPPDLPDQSKPILFWLRAFRASGNRFGKVQLVVANAVQAQQARQARPESLGTGNGQPNQTYRLVNRPVLDGTLQLQVEGPSGWQNWSEIDGLWAAGVDAQVYALDPEAGVVRFGNALQGAVPQIGQRIRAVQYLYGGSAAGNVPSGAISKLFALPPGSDTTVLSDIKAVSNPLPAHGGSDSESIDAALDRVPGEVRRHDRAVTASDFQELALATPGADVARAECLPLFHPPTRTSNRAGVVTVIVWPRQDVLHPDAPLPDANVLGAVCSWLDARRLVTTELYVVPPTYHMVAVAVGIQVLPGYSVESVRRWVELVIRQYLAPLPPYGPFGGGWPLGRRVYGPELEAAALQVEGIDYLESLAVAGSDDGGQTWVQGTVNLATYEVPDLAEITVQQGPITVQPGQTIGPPLQPSVPVPVPIIRQEC
jgi:hypothetical protein